MAFGLQVFSAAGLLTFDSNVAQGGALAEVYTIPGAASSVRTYPLFPGRGAFVMGMFGQMDLSVVVDLALGYPRATFPAGIPTGTSFLVFIT